MDGSGEGDRDAPREDEPEDRDIHAPVPPADEPLLDIALEPVTDALGELVSVDTPPNAGRTEPDHTSRSGGSAGSRSSRDDADARSPPNDVSSDKYHVGSQRTDDELVVTAELPDVAADELFVGLDEEERSLVVAVDDAIIAREFYPWEAVEVTSTRFDAPDLEVRLEPADEPTSE